MLQGTVSEGRGIILPQKSESPLKKLGWAVSPLHHPSRTHTRYLTRASGIARVHAPNNPPAWLMMPFQEPRAPTDMPFHHLDRISSNDDATKAVFEHFRNMSTCAAVGAAGVWVAGKGDFSSFRGIVTGTIGGTLWFISLCLFNIAIANATHRMRKAGFNKGWSFLLWVFYAYIVVGGFILFAITR